MMKQARKLFKVYVLGNLLVEQDSLPLKLVSRLRDELKGIEFVELDPTEELPEEDHFVLIDTIVGIEEVRILDEKGIDKIELSPQCSLHDFDLGFSLKLMKKLGRIGKVTIIGVPVDGNFDEMINKIKLEIEKCW